MFVFFFVSIYTRISFLFFNYNLLGKTCLIYCSTVLYFILLHVLTIPLFLYTEKN